MQIKAGIKVKVAHPSKLSVAANISNRVGVVVKKYKMNGANILIRLTPKTVAWVKAEELEQA